MAVPLGATTATTAKTAIKAAVKRGAVKDGWFQKIPRDILISPGGTILIFLAVIIEGLDLIPVPLIDQIIELPLEIIFLVFFITIVKPSTKSLIIPFFIERIPGINDFLPTWLLKMFGLF